MYTDYLQIFDDRMTTQLIAQTGTFFRVNMAANTGPSHMVTLLNGQLCMEDEALAKNRLCCYFPNTMLDRLAVQKK